MIFLKTLFFSLVCVIRAVCSTLRVSELLVALKANIVYMIGFVLFSTRVSAAEEISSQITKSDPMNSGYILQLILGLVVVVICIVALAWFAKKMNRFQSMTDGSLQIIAGISMGARERVVLLQVGEEQLLLGVSPGRLSTLHVLDKPIEILTNNAASTFGKSFSEKLKTMMADADKSSADKKSKQ